MLGARSRSSAGREVTDILTVSDLQRELRIGRVQAYELAHALPHIRVGKSIRIERADLEAWKAQQKTGATS